MIKKAVLGFGIFFVVIGILGFFPAFAPNNHLFGVFEIGGVHNWAHILSGLAALVASATYDLSRRYFQVFGVAYSLIAPLGLPYQVKALLRVMNHNVADIFLYAGIAAPALYLGFAAPRHETGTDTVL